MESKIVRTLPALKSAAVSSDGSRSADLRLVLVVVMVVHCRQCYRRERRQESVTEHTAALGVM